MRDKRKEKREKGKHGDVWRAELLKVSKTKLHRILEIGRSHTIRISFHHE